jgi:hypothetical protein
MKVVRLVAVVLTRPTKRGLPLNAIQQERNFPYIPYILHLFLCVSIALALPGKKKQLILENFSHCHLRCVDVAYTGMMHFYMLAIRCS